ncbi:Lin1244/Lin1753 domain-containing protein [Porphyromonas sp.]
MCKHKYIPLDLFALQDAKVEALVAEHGMAGWGIYTALLLKLAQQDKTGYAYPHDPKRLANLLPKRPRPELVRSVVEDFGLFVFCEGDDGGEVFLSPRLQSHLTGISKYAEVATQVATSHPQVVTSPSEVVTEVATSLEDKQVKPKRTYSEEAREKMAKGGRSGGQRSKRIYDCGEPSDEKAEPSDEKAEPSDEKAKPSDEKAKPSDEKAKPSDEKAKPSDEKAKPSAKPSDEKAKPSGGTIGGKDKEEDEVEDKSSLPLTPTGGMESERRELEQIEDLGLRQMVSSLLYPNSDMRDYAKAFSELYTIATAGLTEFAQLKTLSRAFASDAQELFWALMPEDEQGRKVRPSVLDVLGAIEQFRAMLDEAKASSFLRSKPAMATLTWLIKVDNFAKVAAGNYRDASPSPLGTKPPVGNYSNSMWDKVKAEQAQKEETPEMRAYRERTQAMAKEVMARINQGG